MDNLKELLQEKIDNLEGFIKALDDKGIDWTTDVNIEWKGENVRKCGYIWTLDESNIYDGKISALKELLEELKVRENAKKL